MRPRHTATVLALAASISGILTLEARQGPAVVPAIRGTVLDARTGSSIAGVVITRHLPSTQPFVPGPGGAPPPQLIQTRTDAMGQFLIQKLDAGRITIVYEHEGYYQATLPYSLSPGDMVQAIPVRLVPKGVVVGRVLDSSGKPLVHARVQPLYYRFWDNRVQLASQPVITTNDRGEYRLIDLPPGRYFLNVAPPMPLAGNSRFGGPAQPDSEQGPLGAALYPGSTTTLDDATSVEVKSGQETRLQDVVLTSARFGEVRVRVINTSQQPLKRVIVTIANSTPEFAPDGSAGIYGPATNNNDEKLLDALGSMAMTVWPNALGVHTVVVALAGENYRRTRVATLSFDFDGKPRDLEITVPSPPADGLLSCRLNLPADANTSSNNVRVVLRSAANDTISCPGPTTVPAGTYQVTNVAGLAADWYVAGIDQDSRDVLRNGVVVSQAEMSLNVRIASGAGSFDGKVVDSDGRPVQNALVALLPEASLKDTPLANAFKSMRTDQYGMVNIRGIMPGEYAVYAWNDVEDNVHRIPGFVKQYEGRGKRLTVGANAKISENLTVIDD